MNLVLTLIDPAVDLHTVLEFDEPVSFELALGGIADFGPVVEYETVLVTVRVLVKLGHNTHFARDGLGRTAGLASSLLFAVVGPGWSVVARLLRQRNEPSHDQAVTEARMIIERFMERCLLSGHQSNVNWLIL